MDQNIPPLPPGFQLESGAGASPSLPPLPPGFQLEAQPSTAMDMLRSLPAGIREGIEGVAGLPGDLTNLAHRAITYVGDKTGLPTETANKLLNAAAYVSPFLGHVDTGDIHGATSKVVGDSYEPQTTPGEYMRTIGQFAPGLVAGPEGVAPRIAATVIPALTSETAGQLTKNTVAEPYARFIGSLLGVGGVAAAPKVARTTADIAGGVAGVGNEGRANRAIVSALTRSGKSPQEIDAALSQAAAEGQPVYTVADAIGNPGQRMLSGVARSPGEGRQAVVDAMETRQAGQGRRVASQLDQAFKGEGTAAQNAATIKDTARVVNANPYAKAYDEGEKAIWSPELERLGSAPAIENAMKGALNIWRDTAIADGYGAMNPRALVEKGELKFKPGGLNVFPNLQFWDYTKRVLDDEIATAVMAGADSKVRTLTKLKKTMVAELDKAVPSYADARSTAKGFFDIQDAIEAGTNAAKRGRTEDTTQLFNSLNPEQQQAFRTGYVDPLIESTQGAAHGVNKARPLINDATAVEFPAFAAQSGEKLQRQLARENTMFETRNAALGGSKTADNVTDIADVNPSTVIDMVRHPVVTGARHLVGSAVNAAMGRNEATRALIADALLRRAPNGSGLDALIQSTGKNSTSLARQAIVDAILASTKTRELPSANGGMQ